MGIKLFVDEEYITTLNSYAYTVSAANNDNSVIAVILYSDEKAEILYADENGKIHKKLNHSVVLRLTDTCSDEVCMSNDQIQNAVMQILSSGLTSGRMISIEIDQVKKYICFKSSEDKEFKKIKLTESYYEGPMKY